MWHNLYGCPVKVGGDASDMMNENPEIASTWKGRILLHIDCEDSQHPEKAVQRIEDGIKEKAINQGYFNNKQYEVVWEVGMGICLPETQAYKVRFKIGEWEVETDKPVEKKDHYNRWRGRQISKMECKYTNIDNMGDIFIQLMDGDKPVCYWRGPASDFKNLQDVKWRWMVLKNDKALNVVENDWQAGMVQLKLYIRDL